MKEVTIRLSLDRLIIFSREFSNIYADAYFEVRNGDQPGTQLHALYLRM